MITPISYSSISKESIELIANRQGVDNPIKHAGAITPAVLAASIGLRDMQRVLDTCGYELGHFYLSFYMESSCVDEMLSTARIQVLKVGFESYIVTASILEWRQAIINSLVREKSLQLRKDMNIIFAYLRDNGFSRLFSEYKRVSLPLDGSLILESIDGSF